MSVGDFSFFHFLPDFFSVSLLFTFLHFFLNPFLFALGLYIPAYTSVLVFAQLTCIKVESTAVSEMQIFS